MVLRVGGGVPLPAEGVGVRVVGCFSFGNVVFDFL